ncbi:MAG: low molecular weight protein arginine phosphatase [Candidatus Promineifilaceae bacterium]
MPHILFVCTANICRSPVAEALLRQKLAAHPDLDDSWTVSSAGTWALVGSPPSLFSQQLLQDRGLDISQKRAQMVTRHLLQEADLILCMSAGHLEALRQEFPESTAKLFLLSEMVGLHYSIADPYGGSLEGYQAMVDELDRLITAGLPRIISLVRPPM